jgi:drug/metabolite transporter (DMT)-like permease
MQPLTLGILGGLSSALTWALITTLSQALADRFSPVGINGFRATVGGLAILAGALAGGYGSEIVGMPLWAALTLWLSVIIGYAGGDAIFFGGMRHLGVTRAHTLSMAHPLMSTLVGALFLGEPITPTRALGILLVIGGITLIVTGQREGGADGPAASPWRGVRLILIAAASWTVAAVLLKAPLTVVSPVTATAIRNPVAGLALWMSPWARGTWAAVVGSRGRQAQILLAICLLSALSPVLFTVGIKYAGVGIGSVLATTAPLFTIPLETVVLGRRPGRRTIAGAVTTVVGIWLMS